MCQRIPSNTVALKALALRALKPVKRPADWGAELPEDTGRYGLAVDPLNDIFMRIRSCARKHHRPH